MTLTMMPISLDHAIALIRVVVGVLLMGHGAQKLFGWFGGHGPSGTASWLGLVLMFLGLGYLLLWWFEDRHLQRHETGADRGIDVGKS